MKRVHRMDKNFEIRQFISKTVPVLSFFMWTDGLKTHFGMFVVNYNLDLMLQNLKCDASKRSNTRSEDAGACRLSTQQVFEEFVSQRLMQGYQSIVPPKLRSLASAPKVVGSSPRVDDVELVEEQYTLDHMRTYGMYNHLHADPWHHDSLYFVDRAGRLVNVRVVLDTHVEKGKPVWQLPWEGVCTQGRVCASLSFPSEELAAVADGTGSLHLLRTGCRGEEGTIKWEMLLSVEVPPASLLVHTVTLEGRTDCLLLRVEPDEAVESKSGFRTALEWITLSAASGSTCLELTRRRTLHGLCAPHYVALEPSGAALIVAADRPFRFISDSANPVEPELPCSEAEMPDEDENERQKVVLYRWQQSADDVTVTFSLVECTVKADVEVEVKSRYLKVGLKGQQPLLEGELAGPADADGTTWLLSDGRLEITIQKASAEGSQNWTEVVKGDQRGELDPEFVAAAHEAVSHLTTDDMVRAGTWVGSLVCASSAKGGKTPCLTT
uniref:nudC domain-containing protein 1-like n=2 Tax=Myxine glutinosa TaxID=7769 RepID=UPI0035902034